MPKCTRYTADILQDVFVKTNNGEKTVEQFARWLGVSEGSINNYILARKKYENGLEVNAQNVSIPIFTEWAAKYGDKGEPIFKKESGDRKHVKKKAVQISVEELCPQEDVASYCDETVKLDSDSPLEPFEDITVSELSAKDKKELAMYAIDQHYFFLKQLTGVI